MKTPGQIAYEAAAKVSDCNQPWEEANQVKWEAAANAVVEYYANSRSTSTSFDFSLLQTTIPPSGNIDK